MGNNFCCKYQQAPEYIHPLPPPTDLSKTPPYVDEQLELAHIYVPQDLGSEERKQATKQDLQNLYCQIGLIVFQTIGSKQLFYATGFLIQQNLILTSAHTFLHRDMNKRTIVRNQPIRFYFQLTGKYTDKSKYEVQSYRINQVYHDVMIKKEGDDFDLTQRLAKDMIPHDYAIIKLKTSIPKFQPPKILINYKINPFYSPDNSAIIYGYSQNHRLLTQDNQQVGALIVGQEKIITNIQDNYINHNIQTSKCQSGSPVFLKRKNNEGVIQHFLIGIHSGYFLTKKLEKYAVLFSQPVIDRLKTWYNQFTPEKQQVGFDIFKQIENSKKLKIEETVRIINQPLQAQVTKKVSMEQHKQKRKQYKQFDIVFDRKFRQSKYYSVQTMQNGNQQLKVIKRVKNLPLFQNKPFHFISENAIPHEKLVINLTVTKFSNEPIIIGFMNQYRKGEAQFSGFLDQKQCVSLCLQKDSMKKQEIATILSDGVVLKRIPIKPYQEKRSIQIFINLQDKIIYWAMNAINIYSCLIPQSVYSAKVLFFIGLNDTSQEVIIKHRLRENSD